jgi:hypothetical protein
VCLAFLTGTLIGRRITTLTIVKSLLSVKLKKN